MIFSNLACNQLNFYKLKMFVFVDNQLDREITGHIILKCFFIDEKHINLEWWELICVHIFFI